MIVRWVTAFVDVPIEAFERSAGFWCAVTGSRLSARRGETEQFATFLPADGDVYLRIQATADGSAGVHIDMHSDDVDALAERAIELGATVGLRPDGLVVMRSPGGLPFCSVAHHGEATRPAPLDRGAGPSIVDQVCIDVPAPLFEAEVAFWAGVTGWPVLPGKLTEFQVLDRPDGMPLRLLLQKLGDDDPGDRVRAHLDISCGPNAADHVEWHVDQGAEFVHPGAVWTTLQDPAGLEYCLTQRDPTTGRIEA